jgi:hypothetical protein
MTQKNEASKMLVHIYNTLDHGPADGESYTDFALRLMEMYRKFKELKRKTKRKK